MPLLRIPISNFTRRQTYRHLLRSSRPQSTQTPPPNPRPRLERLNARLPRFLHRYTTPLLNAPITHVSSFLILHEITAVVPLLTLTAFFHYSGWMPPFISEGKWVSDGMTKFGRWFKRRGWIRDGDAVGADGKAGKVGKRGRLGVWWNRGEGGVRLVVELATAYAITKALLPLRLIFSVWATPWFARVSVIPVMNYVKMAFGVRRKVKVPAAGTGATSAGVVPKGGSGPGNKSG
ncbi:hypothetical protein MMC30_008144 [Trapelia coarctata]|nr:hypothetical protein [Trapelia coarctata]